jgi:hypothetical protein
LAPGFDQCRAAAAAARGSHPRPDPRMWPDSLLRSGQRGQEDDCRTLSLRQHLNLNVVMFEDITRDRSGVASKSRSGGPKHERQGQNAKHVFHSMLLFGWVMWNGPADGRADTGHPSQEGHASRTTVFRSKVRSAATTSIPDIANVPAKNEPVESLRMPTTQGPT